jgi:DNA-binding NtrC family response regulator/tetratricopeptide (TPR) repeat protein
VTGQSGQLTTEKRGDSEGSRSFKIPPGMDVLAELVGESAPILALRKQVRVLIQQFAMTQRIPPVLIQGETGTGKGLLARVMHKAGPRASGPFVDVNCAAIPETMLEVELFGYERGAFTDARQAKPGLFQTAHGGTLFLDEVGLLPRGLQAKLLTVVEQGSVRRLGAIRSEPANVAIIAATNDDLRAAIQAGRVREDLYHRLAVITLVLPPLRERPGDVELLADMLLGRLCVDYGLPRRTLTAEARAVLRRYSWPGNIRELGNVVERAALLFDGPALTATMLELPTIRPSVDEPAVAPGARRRPTREQLIQALERTGWNITRTAAMLGVMRNTVRAQIQRHGLRAASDSSEHAPGATDDIARTSAVARTSAEGVRWERRRVTFLRMRMLGRDDAPATEPRRFDRLVEKIQSFGGRVEDMGQRSLVAVFGHEPAEDAPRRAANAALAIERALGREHAAGDVLGDLAVTAAIHVESVPVARLAGRAEIDHDAKHEVLAALQRLEPPDGGSPAVSEAAARVLARDFDIRRVEHAEHVWYRLVGRGTTSQARAFIGRDREMDLLQMLLDRAREGQGQIVTLTGEAGIGKSRLLREFRHAIGAAGVVAVEGRCASYGTHVPYFPILEILQSVCSVEEADPPETIDTKVLAALEPLGDHAAACAPYVQQLLAPRRIATLSGWSPEAIKNRTFEVLRHIVVAMTKRQAVAVIIEDLHWIDQTSVELLTSLAEIIGTTRTLLVMTSRPGVQAPWGHRSNATQIALGPLSDPHSRRVVDSILGERAPEPLVASIIVRADGNPFFLEELGRAACERHGIVPHTVPETIYDVLATRIEGLTDDDKRVIHLAAVLGRDAPLSILREASDVAAENLRGSLTRLQSAEFLYSSRVGADPQYTFRHALIHDVAYDSVPDNTRAALHERAAAAIEKLAPETRERRPETLARHYTAAGRRGEAIECWYRAGQLAIQRSAHHDAIAHLTEALTLLEGEPASAERTAQELKMQLALATSLTAGHGYAAPEVEAALGRIRTLSDELEDPDQQFSVRFGLWRFHLSRAELGPADDLAVQLLAFAQAGDDLVSLVGASVANGINKFYLGELALAQEHLERAVRSYDRSQCAAHLAKYGQDLGVAAFGFLGWTLGVAGDVNAAQADVERAVDLARDIHHPFSLALALLTASEVHELRREPERVRLFGDELVSLAHEHGMKFFSAIGLMHAGWARAAGDDRPEGLPMMEEGDARFRAAGQRLGFAFWARLAEVLIACGRLDNARRLIDDGLTRIGETRRSAFVAEYFRLEGEIRLRYNESSEAVASLRKAVDLGCRQGAWLFALRAATALARLDSSARDDLEAVVRRFPPELELPDLTVARATLARPR